MAEQKIKYQVSFTTDTSQLKKSLNETISTLEKLGSSSSMQLTKGLREGSQYALELGKNLRLATNQKTGQLDLTKFNQQLKSSGMTLEAYAMQLRKLGPEGKAAFLSMASSIAQAEPPVRRMTTMMEKLGTTLQNTLRWQISTAALHAVTGAFQSAFGYAKDLNASLNSIRIVSGQSVKEMKEFAKYANDSARALSTTTTDYTDASLIYFQQGLAEEEVKKRTDVTIKMANAAGVSAREVSDNLTAVWNNFYNGSKSLEYYADVMVKLGAATASSTDEISQGVEKFAAVANTIGLSYEYATAALATVTAETRQSADVVGTSFRTIFARLQSLKLGEDLEDGTSLGKYSQALKAVGVDIKDANGELKNMDIILSELGKKWQTLSKDEQVALAQTVAGQRQYAQLVALMDRWDIFKKNLGIAYGSEGALTEQANIYAESWEAARDRVKASWENVADSLIDEQLFIDADNVVTPVLNFIAEISDGLGGLKGLISLIGTLLLSNYGPKIAEGMSTMYSYILNISGVEAKRARVLQQTAVEQAKKKSYVSFGKEYSLEMDMLNKRNELQGEINLQYDHFSTLQKEQVRVEQEQLDILGKTLQKYHQSSEAARIKLEDTDAAIYDKFTTNSPSFDRIKNLIPFMNTIQSKEWLGDIYTGVEPADIIAPFQTSAANLTQENVAINSLKESLIALSGQTSNTSESFEQFKVRAIELVPSLKAAIESATNFTQVSNILNKALESNKLQLKDNEKVIRSLGAGQLYQQLILSAEQHAQAKINETEGVKLFDKAYEEFLRKLQAGMPVQKTLSNQIVSFSNYMLQASMAIQSVQNLGNIWNNDDITMGEKLLQSISAISLALPVAVRGFKDLSGALGGTKAAQEALAASRTAASFSSVLQGVNTSALGGEITTLEEKLRILRGNTKDGIGQKQEGSSAYISKKKEIAETEKLLKLKQEQKIASDAQTAALEKEAAAQKALNAAKLKAVVAIAAVVAVVAITVAIYKHFAEAQQRAKEKIEKATEAVKEEQDKLDELNDTLKTTQDRIKELKEQGTLSFVEQDELNRLKSQENLLKQQVTLQERLVAAKEKQQALTFEENFEKAYPGPKKGADIVDTTDNIDLQVIDVDDLLFGEDVEYSNTMFSDESRSQTYNYKTEIKRLENRLAEALKKYETLSKEEQDRIDIEEYQRRLQEDYIDYYKEKYEGLVVEAQQNAIAVEEQYQTALKAYNNGYMDSKKLESVAETLREYRMAAISEDLGQYYELYIKPVLDEDSLQNVKEKILQNIQNGSDKDVVLSSNEKAIIRMYGLDPDTWQDDIEKVYNSLYKKLHADDFYIIRRSLKELSLEDLELALQINPETYDSFDELELRIEELKATKINIFDTENLEEAKELLEKIQKKTLDPLEKAFNSYSSNKGFLTPKEALELINEDSSFAKYLKEGADGNYVLTKQALEDYKVKTQQVQDLINGTIEASQGEEELSAGELLDKYNNALPDDSKIEIDIKNIEDYSDLLDEIHNKMTVIDKKTGHFYLSSDFNETKVTIYGQLISDIIGQITKQYQKGKISAVKYYDTLDKAIARQRNLIGKSYEEYIEYETAQQKYSFKDPEKILNWGKNGTEEEKAKAQQLNEVLKNLNDSYETSIELRTKIIPLTQALADSYETLKKAAVIDRNGMFAFSEDESGKLEVEEAVQKQLLDILKSYKKATEDLKIILQQSGLGETAINAIVDSVKNKEINWETFKDILGKNFNADQLNSIFNNILKDSLDIEPDVTSAVGNLFTSLGEAIKDFNLEIKVKFVPEKTGLGALLSAIRSGTTLDIGKFSFSAGNQETAAEIGNAMTQLGSAFANKNLTDRSGMENYNPNKPTDNDETVTVDEINNALGKGTSTTKTYTEKTKESRPKLSDPYKDLNAEIELYEKKLKEIEELNEHAYGPEKIEYYNQEIEKSNKLIELQKQLQRELFNDLFNNEYGSINYFNQNNALGLQLLYDGEDQMLLNEGDILEKIYNEKVRLTEEYNAKIDAYNAKVNAGTVTEQNEKQMQVLDKKFKNDINNLKEYEDEISNISSTVSKLSESIDDETEQIRKKWDNTFAIGSDVYSRAIKRIDLRDTARELNKKVIETFGDGLKELSVLQQKNLDGANWAVSRALEASRRIEELRVQLNEPGADKSKIQSEIESALSEQESSIQSILDWVEEFKSGWINALSAIEERVSSLNDQLEHNKIIASSIKELMTLQGITSQTYEGNQIINKVYQSNLESSRQQYRLNKQMYEQHKKNIDDMQKLLANETEGSPAYNKILNDIETETTYMNDYQQKTLGSAKEMLETLNSIYEENISYIFNKFDQTVSGNQGLELLQEKYEHLVEEEERYNDLVNTNYEATKLNNKIENSLLETNSKLAADKLRSLQREIEMRKQNNKLSKYDVDLLNAKYNLTLAQMALEDAQNAKTTARLVRNASGNWDYQFTADQNSINNAQQQVNDAQNELYNIEKDQMKSLLSEAASLNSDFSKRLQEIANDTTLTDKERKAQIEETQRYYKKKADELNIKFKSVKNDLGQLGIDIYNEWGSQYGDMINRTESMVTDFDRFSNMLISDFYNTVTDYKNGVNKITEETGTSLDDLKIILDNTNTSTKNLGDSLNTTIENLWLQADGLKNSIELLNEYRIKAEQAATATNTFNRATSKEVADNQEGSNPAGEYREGVDYLQLMIDYWLSQGSTHTWDDTMEKYNRERDAKSQAEGRYDVTQGQQTKDAFENGDFNNYYYDEALAQERWERYKKAPIKKFDTGGYTGIFQGGRLALLHQKELVLNQEDTQNILSAVAAVRSIGPALFQQIERILDANAKAGFGLMSSKLSANFNTSMANEREINQNVVIQADFPGVSSAVEIEAALRDLVNNAAQEASIY